MSDPKPDHLGAAFAELHQMIAEIERLTTENKRLKEDIDTEVEYRQALTREVDQLMGKNKRLRDEVACDKRNAEIAVTALKEFNDSEHHLKTEVARRDICIDEMIKIVNELSDPWQSGVPEVEGDYLHRWKNGDGSYCYETDVWLSSGKWKFLGLKSGDDGYMHIPEGEK